MAFMAVLLLASLAAYSVQADTDPTTTVQLTPLRKQLGITIFRVPGGDQSMAAQQICNFTDIHSACHQPILSHQDKDVIAVKVKLLAPAAGLQTLGNLTYEKSIVKLCYSAEYAKDRAWRKANPIIAKDRSCPLRVASFKFNATNVMEEMTFNYVIPDNITMATWYARVLTQCMNGTTLQYCQFDGTVNSTFVATTTVPQTNPALIGTSVVFATLGPLIFVGYAIMHHLKQKKATVST